MRPTFCQRHPHLELTHVCPQADCKGAVFCTECARQQHRNHQTIPLKNVCESKLNHLKVMKDAIEQNREQVQSARKKLEDNKSEMHDILNSRVKDLHAQLDQVAKKNADHIDKMTSEAQDVLTVKENDIQKAEDLLKVLETEFSDKIQNIVRSNADNHLETNFDILSNMLTKWSLGYSCLKVTDFELFTNSNKEWVVKMPEKTVKGASATLSVPVVPVVKPKVVTSRKRAAPIASTSQMPLTQVTSSPNNSQPKKRKDKEVVNSDSGLNLDFNNIASEIYKALLPSDNFF